MLLSLFSHFFIVFFNFGPSHVKCDKIAHQIFSRHNPRLIRLGHTISEEIDVLKCYIQGCVVFHCCNADESQQYQVFVMFHTAFTYCWGTSVRKLEIWKIITVSKKGMLPEVDF